MLVYWIYFNNSQNLKTPNMKYCIVFALLALYLDCMMAAPSDRTPITTTMRTSSATHRVNQRRRTLDKEAVWTTWSHWTPCSFTCDRGVRSRYRGCVQRSTRGLVRQVDERCDGKPREYQICEEEPCPMGSGTPKEYQCAQKNNDLILEKLHEWVPLHTGVDQCELTCMARGYAFYNSFGQVTDGTPCDERRHHDDSRANQETVCINGTCQVVGCDEIVDSGTRLDMCRKCGGENKNCYHFRKSFMVLEPPEQENGDYKDMVLIPAGATYVEVTEHGNNYLALADDSGTFIMNGNWMIDWPGKYEVDGTVIMYERRGRAEILTMEGPTTQNLTLKLLFRERNPGVHFEFYVPSHKTKQIELPVVPSKTNTSPVYVPPPFRRPQYGPGSDVSFDEVDDENEGSHVTQPDDLNITTTDKSVSKGGYRGMEIPLARALDKDGNMIELQQETETERPNDQNFSPEDSETETVRDSTEGVSSEEDSIPWYLRAHRSEEYDELVQGGIPLQPTHGQGGQQLLSQPTYQWPANNNYNFALYGPQQPHTPYKNPRDPHGSLNSHNPQHYGLSGERLGPNQNQLNMNPYNQQLLAIPQRPQQAIPPYPDAQTALLDQEFLKLTKTQPNGIAVHVDSSTGNHHQSNIHVSPESQLPIGDLYQGVEQPSYVLPNQHGNPSLAMPSQRNNDHIVPQPNLGKFNPSLHVQQPNQQHYNHGFPNQRRYFPGLHVPHPNKENYNRNLPGSSDILSPGRSHMGYPNNNQFVPSMGNFNTNSKTSQIGSGGNLQNGNNLQTGINDLTDVDDQYKVETSHSQNHGEFPKPEKYPSSSYLNKQHPDIFDNDYADSHKTSPQPTYHASSYPRYQKPYIGSPPTASPTQHNPAHISKPGHASHPIPDIARLNVGSYAKPIPTQSQRNWFITLPRTTTVVDDSDSLSRSRGYVVHRQRQSYLDYYRDRQKRTAPAVTHNDLNRSTHKQSSPHRQNAPGDYHNNFQNSRDPAKLVPHEIRPRVHQQVSQPAAFNNHGTFNYLPNVDDSVHKTLEITPDGEEIILYDLSTYFDRDNKHMEAGKHFGDHKNREKHRSLEPVAVDIKYIKSNTKEEDNEIPTDEDGKVYGDDMIFDYINELNEDVDMGVIIDGNARPGVVDDILPIEAVSVDDIYESINRITSPTSVNSMPITEPPISTPPAVPMPMIRGDSVTTRTTPAVTISPVTSSSTASHPVTTRTPAVTIPPVTTPSTTAHPATTETTPAVTIPHVTTPSTTSHPVTTETTPAVTIPPVTSPSTTAHPVTTRKPAVTIPPVTTPSTTAHPATTETTPAVTIPPVTSPSTTAHPATTETTPAVTIPPVTTPSTTAHPATTETTPAVTIPPVTTPSTTANPMTTNPATSKLTPATPAETTPPTSPGLEIQTTATTNTATTPITSESAPISITTPVTTTGSATTDLQPAMNGGIYLIDRRQQQNQTCPKCTRVKDWTQSFCQSDLAARVTAHSSKVLGGEIRYKITLGEIFHHNGKQFNDHYIWLTNTCRCPRLRRNTDYLVMAHIYNGRLVLSRKSYTKRFRTRTKKRLYRLNQQCSAL